MPTLTAATVDVGANGQWRAAQGTITADNPAWNSTATWNAGGVTFTHLKANVTDTASAAASLLADLQVGGSSQWKVTKGGAWTSQGGGTIATGGLTVTAGTSTFGAAVNINATTTISSTSGSQLAVRYDGSNLLGIDVSSAGVVSYNASGASAKHAFLDAVDITGSLTASGTAYIGDTSNANVTLGLTVNQGAADDQIFALKSSDVAHGMTDIAETDTFGYIAKPSAMAGGAALTGLSEATRAVQISGFGTTDNTTKTTAGDAYIYLDARIKSVATVGTPGADANLVAIGAGSTVRFIFDVEGSAHADVEWIAF